MITALVVFVCIIAAFIGGSAWEYARRGGTHDWQTYARRVELTIACPPQRVAPVIPLRRRGAAS